jgi:hypothetical protein
MTHSSKQLQKPNIIVFDLPLESRTDTLLNNYNLMIASKWEFPGTLTRRTGWTGWDPARLLLPADLVRHPAENLQQKQRFHHRNIDSIYHHQFTIPNTLIQCQHKDHSIILLSGMSLPSYSRSDFSGSLEKWGGVSWCRNQEVQDCERY